MKIFRFWLQKTLALVDNYLGKLTSYRLVLYLLISYSLLALILSFFNQIPFHWYSIILSAAWLVAVCRYVNLLWAREKNVPVNIESDLITALILLLIMSPAQSLSDFIFLGFAGAIAMTSKYMLVLNRAHLFNPAAVGAVVAGAVFNYYASWWVGTKALTPLLIIGGFLIVRKMRRGNMVGLFLAVYLVLLTLQQLIDQSLSITGHTLWLTVVSTSLIFFATIMLTEPFTSPHIFGASLVYAAAVAIFYWLPGLKAAPEGALLLGNLVTYLLNPNPRRTFVFEKRRREAPGIDSYIFKGKTGLKYSAGQYMEWTIASHKSDSRGNRRYLTLSSSPSEDRVMFTVRIPEDRSSFKQYLEQLEPGAAILADQLGGDFVLPHSEKQKLVFVAGGIGITPFRSMVKYMVDFKQERQVQLIYAANKPADFVFEDLFAEAIEFGVKTHYVVTDEPPASWEGLSGAIAPDMVRELVEDYANRTFYISGPPGFVHAVEASLLELGVTGKQVVKDFFPGYE
jgi:ferredoxin-NADP reductase